ncbi:MAG TPA: hypothetical protein VF411_08120 [Bacteroidia bacterium]
MLDEKEPKSQDKTICPAQASLPRVLSGLRTVFRLRWLPKSGQMSTNGANWIFLVRSALLYATRKNPVGVCGGFLPYFFAIEKSMFKKINEI